MLMNMATLKLRPSLKLLDATSAYMFALVQRPSTYTVEAHSIATLLYSLYKLRHLPDQHQALGLLKRFAKLCSASPLHKKGLRDATNVLVAAAGLGLTEVQPVVQEIGLQVMNTARISSQDLCIVC